MVHSVIQRQLSKLFIGLALTLTAPVFAGSVSVQAVNKAGDVMSDVVVFATPVGRPVPPATKVAPPVIAQQQMQFTPYVTVIRAGTDVVFPNYDKVEHHVKSFSAAKEFEIKPYQKVTPPPVDFDKTGIVVVYCLLHEWMRAYVMIVDTPYFGKTESTGAVNLDNLPDGKYEIRAWHPDMGTIKTPLLKTVDLKTGQMQQLIFNFDFIPKKRRAAKLD